ncbi:AraC family transcriptional regulator [Bermanella marisrubri]|uniref:AraC-type DNA-binding domain-containing protein n=1 Tax=Bermanella marisrubri TaxID=207949 RepID=Q1N3I2_9GAMM|nr:AraC family transcriptional regulator [Bermanella marisrubri]EAT12892.1 AraC-type DNA-binding domain-containing protein [Oceanobacter sp. RED65] [Bermanella marisrubri]QIZ83210.1 AraC family transcriptional regulator [Bermanella marisrubri]
MRTSTIASHYVSCAIAGAKRQGLDVHDILRRADITPDILNEPKARIFPDKMAKLLRILVSELNDEFLGLDDKPSPRGSFETLCQLIVPCSTLREALLLGTQFYGLFDMALETQYADSQYGGMLRAVEKRPCLDEHHYLTEFQLVLWHRLACWLTGKRIPIELAEFNYAKPEHSDEYRLFFYGERLFQRPQTALHFKSSYLDLPIVRTRNDLPELLKEAPYVFLVKPNNTTSINAQIRRILQGNMDDSELPDFETVAHKLNTSTQTLRRRLKEENTSFQAIKDQVRRDMAIYYLGDPNISINEIALKVGFTEPSTFHRAFKKWTGMTPGDYRSEQAQPA